MSSVDAAQRDNGRLAAEPARALTRPGAVLTPVGFMLGVQTFALAAVGPAPLHRWSSW